MKKELIGKYFTFQLPGRKDDVSGVALAYNDEYTLIRRFVDYTADGYTIFKNQKVEYFLGDHEKRATAILKRKAYRFKTEPDIPIDSLNNILSFIGENYQLIQLDTRDGEASDIVRFEGQDGKFYLFTALTVNAKWSMLLKLPEKECRCIHFDNNYLNSLKLITKF